MKVDFYRRSHGKSELGYVRDCVSSGMETDGFFMDLLKERWRGFYPGTDPLFTTSCTTALETAVGCLGLSPGDEVILPSFNFPSAANAVLMHGGTPVFCDIDGDTQNLSVENMMARIGPRTRAVVAVHYAGVSCPMEGLLAAAREAGLALVEDAAQGIDAGYIDSGGNLKLLGTIGDFGAVSFHHTKNITCGEGGVLLSKDPDGYRRAVQYRLHGTNRSMFLAGETECYTWNMPGSCTAMGELPAAVLASQMEVLKTVTKRRLAVADGYRERLGELEGRGIARLMKVPEYARPNGHIFYLRFETENWREKVRERLLEAGMGCRTHYVPLHMSPQGEKLGYRRDDLKESAACYRTLLRLPIHGEMGEEQVEYVSETVRKACLG